MAQTFYRDEASGIKMIFKWLLIATLVILVLCNNVYAEPPIHRCSAEAVSQAKKLLEFHFGPDNRMEINKNVKTLKPFKNPAAKDYYDVLEVWGTIYKGSYRMRFIYARMEGCVLMGQEILEYANVH